MTHQMKNLMGTDLSEAESMLVDVYRQLAGESLRLLSSVPGQAPPPAGRGADVTGSFDIVDDDASAVTGTRISSPWLRG